MGKTSRPNAAKRQDTKRQFPKLGEKMSKEQTMEFNQMHNILAVAQTQAEELKEQIEAQG